MGIFFQGSNYEDETKRTSSYTESSSNDDYFSFDSDDDSSIENFFSESGEIAEKPSAKPYDQCEISVPKSSEISADAWNKQLEQQRRSFRESVDIINSIKAVEY